MKHLETVNTFLTLFESVETMDLFLKSLAFAVPFLLVVLAWKLPALLQVRVEKMKAETERMKLQKEQDAINEKESGEKARSDQ